MLHTFCMCIVICLPTLQMTLSNVPIHEEVPPPLIDSVEEYSIPRKNQHSPSPYVADVEQNDPPNAPSSNQHAVDTSHHVKEADTIQEATQEAIKSSDKRSEKPLRPPGAVELGIVHMPPHLQDKDLMWSANEMRLLQKSDYNTIISQLHTKPIKKSRFLIPLCRLNTGGTLLVYLGTHMRRWGIFRGIIYLLESI